jgi:DNA-binding transcriptional LysR family regulator
MDRFALLEAFVAVVDAGSFSRAADRLAAGKSIVSRRVTELERHLGTQLLQRTTRTLSLTTQGQAFYEHAVRILGDLEEAEHQIIDAAEALRGKLRIAAPLSFGLHHLCEAVSDFMADHPGVELDLDLNDREVNLVDEGFDMAIRIGDLTDSTLIARRLGLARFATCASPGYLAAHGTPQHPDDLTRHTGLHYANAPPAQIWQFEGLERDRPTAIPGIRMRANNGDVLAAAAIAGLGIVNLPTFIVADPIRDGRLAPILTAFQRQPIGIHALFPPGRLMPRRLQIFADYLRGRFGDQPYWDEGLPSSGPQQQKRPPPS